MVSKFESEESARAIKSLKLRESRKGATLLAFLSLGVAVVSGWSWTWYALYFGIVWWLVANHMLSRASEVREFRPEPMPLRVPSQDEESLARELERIDAAISRHRRVLNDGEHA
jgi:hypothetical protein